MAENQGSDSLEDKTEEPSSQRLEDFREEGHVAQSKEVTSLLVLAATLAVMYSYGSSIVSDFLDFVRVIFSRIADKELNTTKAGELLFLALKQCGHIVLPIAIAGFVAGVVGSVLQFGFIFSWTPIEPQLDRMNPWNGIRRIFSVASLMEVVKSLMKLAAVIVVTFILVKSEILGSASTLDMEGAQLFAYMGSTAFRLIASVSMGLLVVAAADLGYQKYRYHQSLMMTKQEVKQEHKQREGDPLLKARIRSMQRERARKRMMAEVPKADVVVTNPTHIAVALRYDNEKMAAPKVVAKGSDLLAQRIKEVARKNNIPLVENVPLARALHKTVKVGGSVPRSLYQAVAEVLAYVYRLKGRMSL